VVRGDSVRLVQIVTNLLTNAAKYTEPSGHIRIRADGQGSMACIDVQDDGVGIAKEMLPRVFGLFVQAPQTIDRARGGLGLGLPIVQGLVRAFGGTVSVHSDGLGRGSRFRVELPLYEANSRHPSTPPAPAPHLAQAKRVLIVDDNTDALEVMAEALSLLGYRAHPASNAQQALELAERVHPDLALLDIGLPGLDGYELGKRLRALPGLQSLTLVALTGYGQASDRARSQSAGFAAHLVKPVELSVIEKLLKELSAPPRAELTRAPGAAG
jgi:CheY-like chemotaxis protein